MFTRQDAREYLYARNCSGQEHENEFFKDLPKPHKHSKSAYARFQVQDFGHKRRQHSKKFDNPPAFVVISVQASRGTLQCTHIAFSSLVAPTGRAWRLL